MSPEDIKAARDELGMTIASFAFWLGLEGAHGRTLVREMETGKRSASGPINRAIKLALALKGVLDADPDEQERRTAVDRAMEALGHRSEPERGHSIGIRP